MRETCSTCRFFESFFGFFPYVDDDGVRKVTDRAFAYMDDRGVGICLLDGPMPTGMRSTPSESEQWDCWEEGTHAQEGD